MLARPRFHFDSRNIPFVGSRPAMAPSRAHLLPPPSLDNRPIFDPYRRVDLAPDMHPLARSWRTNVAERRRTVANVAEYRRIITNATIVENERTYIYRMIVEMIRGRERDEVSCKRFTISTSRTRNSKAWYIFTGNEMKSKYIYSITSFLEKLG